MGRFSTGIATTNSICRVDLNYLLKNGFIVKDKRLVGSLNWHTEHNPNMGKIQIETLYTDKEAWIRLYYTLTELSTGVKTNYDYKVYLEAVKSNLGKGEILYMICPVSGKRCKILYRAYGSHIWKSREAYTHRIYYSCQAVSKFEYANNRYWTIEDKQEKAPRFRNQTHYKGQPTKRYIRGLQVDVKKQRFDIERWEQTSMNLSMIKAMATGLYDDMIPQY